MTTGEHQFVMLYRSTYYNINKVVIILLRHCSTGEKQKKVISCSMKRNSLRIDP